MAASLNELMQLAQFQMANERMNNPANIIADTMTSVNDSYKNYQKDKEKSRLHALMSEAASKGKGFSYQYDPTSGDMKISYAPEKTVHPSIKVIGDSLVQFDPESGDFSELGNFPQSPKKMTTKEIVDSANKMVETGQASDFATAYKKVQNIDSGSYDPSAELSAADAAGAAAKNKYDPNNVSSWKDVPVLSRIMAAITPSTTPEEKKLGGLRPGGVFLPPDVKAGGKKETSFDANTENVIRENMKAYGKSRNEVVDALKRRGLLIMN
jgi:hypothetical protein